MESATQATAPTAMTPSQKNKLFLLTTRLAAYHSLPQASFELHRVGRRLLLFVWYWEDTGLYRYHRIHDDYYKIGVRGKVEEISPRRFKARR